MPVNQSKNLIRQPTGSKRPFYEESLLQQSMIEYANFLQIGKERISDHLFAIPNGGSRNIVEATRLKREGVKAGVSDLFLALPNQNHHGLWIEVKTQKGRLTKAQEQWLADKVRTGYGIAVARSLEQFKQIIIDYTNNKELNCIDSFSE